MTYVVGFDLPQETLKTICVRSRTFDKPVYSMKDRREAIKWWLEGYIAQKYPAYTYDEIRAFDSNLFTCLTPDEAYEYLSILTQQVDLKQTWVADELFDLFLLRNPKIWDLITDHNALGFYPAVNKKVSSKYAAIYSEKISPLVLNMTEIDMEKYAHDIMFNSRLFSEEAFAYYAPYVMFLKDSTWSRKGFLHWTFIQKKQMTPELLREAYVKSHEEDVQGIRKIAFHANTPPDILTELSSSVMREYRLAVAMNANAPIDGLENLSSDHLASVREAALETLNKLENSYV